MSKTKEFITELFKESQVPCIELIGKCQVCKKEVKLVIFQSDIMVPDGNGGMIVGDGWNDKPEFKCSECLERDRNLISPTRCEVFSRVCGYLRPIANWNRGKQAEKVMRKDFKV